jgi:hypothetical protein
MDKKKEMINPWTSEDEREHFPSVIEWWAGEAFFKSIDDNKKWSLKASFTEWLKKTNTPGSNIIITLFDIDNNKYFCYYDRDDSNKLNSDSNCLKICFKDSTLEGSYPNYEMHLYDHDNKISINLKFLAKSLPHWIAQDITNGWLPMSLGFYRYGFIPKCDINGKMIIDGNIQILEGKGYFEHVWGNFSYTNPIKYATKIKKTISTYSKLIGWWIHNHQVHIPKSIVFCTDNNPRGYDWIWALFDNGWSLFYGNILLWIMKGPIFGSLIISKDDKTYTEFCNVIFEYKDIKYVKEYDFYYPLEIAVNAKNGKEELFLCFKMNTISRELKMKLSGNRNELFICEAPGIVSGYYFDGEKKLELSGICKIEPQRQVSRFGHNSLKLDFLLPPKGFGIDINFLSHYLKKKVTSRFYFYPYPSFRFKVNKLKNRDYDRYNL